MECATRMSAAHVVDGYPAEYQPIEGVRDAERAFVERRFRRALKLSTLMLKQDFVGHNGRDETTNTAQLLSVPPSLAWMDDGGGECRNGEKKSAVVTLRVDLSSIVSPADKVAVILLQSCHELKYRKTRMPSREIQHGIAAFLDFYYGSQKDPMPLSVAVVWIKYCHECGWHHNALELAAELLHLLCTSFSALAGNTLPDISFELLLFLSTKSLPYAENPAHADKVFKRIFSQTWKPLHFTFTTIPSLNEKAVQVVLSGLDDLMNCRLADDPALKSVKECKLQLEILFDEWRSEGGAKEIEDSNIRGINRHLTVPCSSLPNRKVSWRLSPLTENQEWQTRVVRKLLKYFRINFVEPLYYDDVRWANRGRVVFSAFVTYLAWKRRRKITAAATNLGKVCLAPLLEIFEALMPRKHNQMN